MPLWPESAENPAAPSAARASWSGRAEPPRRRRRGRARPAADCPGAARMQRRHRALAEIGKGEARPVRPVPGEGAVDEGDRGPPQRASPPRAARGPRTTASPRAPCRSTRARRASRKGNPAVRAQRSARPIKSTFGPCRSMTMRSAYKRRGACRSSDATVYQSLNPGHVYSESTSAMPPISKATVASVSISDSEG